jgi:tRNA nucleotidyltransferase (CCA-adding enzyme)
MELVDRVSGHRIREELRSIFARPFPEVALRRLDDLGLLAALEPAWHVAGPAPEYGRLEDALAWAHGQPDVAAHLIDDAAQRMALVFCRLASEPAARLAERLRLPQRELKMAAKAPELPGLLPALQREGVKPSEVDALLRPLAAPLCLALMALSDHPVVWQRIQTYLTDWRHQPAPLTGDDLKALGVPRGPRFARLIDQLRALALDGAITSREEAEAVVRRGLEEEND